MRGAVHSWLEQYFGCVWSTTSKKRGPCRATDCLLDVCSMKYGCTWKPSKLVESWGDLRPNVGVIRTLGVIAIVKGEHSPLFHHTFPFLGADHPASRDSVMRVQNTCFRTSTQTYRHDKEDVWLIVIRRRGSDECQPNES